MATLAFEAWHDFYLALAAAATTFTGLLFVSVSINLEHLRSQAGAQALRVAGRVFSALVVLVFIALIALIPDMDASAFAWTLLLAGAQGLLRLGWNLPNMRREAHLSAAILPALGYLGLGAVAVLVFVRPPQALSILVAPITLLLASAATQAWRLLVVLRGPMQPSNAPKGKSAQTPK